VAEKVLGPLFSRFLSNSSVKTNLSNKTNFRNFRIVENKEGLSIYDSSGKEIFQIDKRV